MPCRRAIPARSAFRVVMRPECGAGQQTLSINCVFTQEGALALHRFAVGGFPKAQALLPARDAGYESALYQIAGCLDEHAFFPFLEGIGLTPRNEVGAAIQNTARMLDLHIPVIREDGATDYWRVVLSANYVQTHLIAPADAAGRGAVLAPYDRPELADFARVGRVVEDEIIAAQQERPEQVTERLERCFHTHLNLNGDDVRVVRRAGA